MAHQNGHILINGREAFQIRLTVGTKNDEIREVMSVSEYIIIFRGEFFLIIVFDFVEFVFEIGTQKFYCLEFLNLFGAEKTNGLNINEKGSLDAPSAAFAHASPVFKGGRNEFVGRDRGNGIVPVADAHRGEGYIDYFSVRIVFGNFDPIAGAN